MDVAHRYAIGIAMALSTPLDEGREAYGTQLYVPDVYTSYCYIIPRRVRIKRNVLAEGSRSTAIAVAAEIQPTLYVSASTQTTLEQISSIIGKEAVVTPEDVVPVCIANTKVLPLPAA